MFKDFDTEMPELALKSDAQLSSDEPSDDYLKYVADRNLCEASESQKLAKLLSKTPPSSGWGSLSTQAAGVSLSAPAAVSPPPERADLSLV